MGWFKRKKEAPKPTETAEKPPISIISSADIEHWDNPRDDNPMSPKVKELMEVFMHIFGHIGATDFEIGLYRDRPDEGPISPDESVTWVATVTGPGGIQKTARARSAARDDTGPIKATVKLAEQFGAIVDFYPTGPPPRHLKPDIIA